MSQHHSYSNTPISRHYDWLQGSAGMRKQTNGLPNHVHGTTWSNLYSYEKAFSQMEFTGKKEAIQKVNKNNRDVHNMRITSDQLMAQCCQTASFSGSLILVHFHLKRARPTSRSHIPIYPPLTQLYMHASAHIYWHGFYYKLN